MASNNLRVLYNNLVDNNNVTTTITASTSASASTPVTNLAVDAKSLIWRSSTTTNGTSPTLTTAAVSFTTQVINPSTGLTVASPSVTATTVTTNYITCASTTGFVVGYPIIFTGTSAGGIISGNVYYISAIVSGTQFTVITATKANLVLTFSSLQAVRLIALPFTNLTTSSIIRVRGYSGTAPVTQTVVDNPVITAGTSTIFDTGYVAAVPYSLSGNWSWGFTSIGVNTFAYGGGTYARVWNAAVNPNCTSLSIEIHDNNPSKYIECSRLVVGDYWTPQYNTQYGLATTMSDTSVNQRTEAGDLITNRGTKYNKVNFNMGYLSSTDRDNLLSIMRGAGISKPIFVSLFPLDSDTGKERAHQVYGKLTGLNEVQHYALGFYSSTLEVEEI